MGELIAFPAAERTRAADPPTVERPAVEPRAVERLWREAAGEELRRERHRAGRTLADVAEQAGISEQYLSEVERGRKEPSSEMLAAAAGALGLRMADLALRAARRLHSPVCLAA